MRSITVTHRFRIAKVVPFQYPRWPPRQPSWNFSNDISSKSISHWAETLWEALERHRDSELLRLFCSDIQDGRHGGHLEILQTTSPPKPKVGLSQNLMGSITVTQRFRIAKIAPFRYPRWPAILKFFKRHLIPNNKSDWAETWWEALESYRDSELLKSFCSRIQDGRHGGHLEILQTTSPPKQ